MKCLQSRGLSQVLPHLQRPYAGFVRNASLTSAINRGIRKGANNLERIGTTRRSSEKDVKHDLSRTAAPSTRSSLKRPERAAGTTRRSSEKDGKYDLSRTAAPRTRFDLERPERAVQTSQRRWSRDQEHRSSILQEAPLGVPYTTAGSEFLYGTFAVRAALEARRRQIHKLYIWRGDRNAGDQHDESIAKLARSRRVQVQEVAGSWDKMLMRMSGQRPHNGYVLEASPIPKLPITSLEQMETPDSELMVASLPQSVEDEAINRTFQMEGTRANIPRSRTKRRYPLLLWLDRVTDTGNLGAILRTAYFFGVDAVIIPEHGTAPFSPITIKASAGSAEYVPVLTVRKELDFVQTSKQKGWKFFAAVAPNSESTRRRLQQQTPSVSAARSLDTGPCVLMVGNEGEGLRTFLQKAADEPLSIQGSRGKHSIVDSLNVSVAAALLVARFFESVEASGSKTSESAGRSEVAPEVASEAVF